MKTLLWVGIDPGLGGAVGVLDRDGNCLAAVDTPIIRRKRPAKKKKAGEKPGKRRKAIPSKYDKPAMAAVLRGLLTKRIRPENVIVVIERLTGRPGQASGSTFKLGQGQGIWEGIVAALGFRVLMIPPHQWKVALLGVTGDKNKKVSLNRARLRWRISAAGLLKREKDEGRAEALLMAEYARKGCPKPLQPTYKKRSRKRREPRIIRRARIRRS